METADLLSIHEVAIRLGAAEETVIGWAQNGTLPAIVANNSYWFRPEDVAAYANTYPLANPPGDGAVNDLVEPPDDPLTPR